MNTKKKGDISVAKFLVKFLEHHIVPSIPWGDCDRYDLIIDVKNLLKIQCKTAWFDEKRDKIRFSKRSVTTKNGKTLSLCYDQSEVDFFCNLFSRQRSVLHVWP